MTARTLRKRRTNDLGPAESGPVKAGPIVPRATADLRKIATPELVGKSEDLLQRLFDSVSDDLINAASLRDRVVAIGVLTDKRQILRGEPSSIIGLEQRKKLDELMPALVSEARRRGLISVGSGRLVKGAVVERS